MFCPNCGKENVKDAKFCAVCGNSLMVKSTNDQAARYVTIPYGQYNGVNSSVTLTETKLRVTCQQNSGHYESEIPYDELVHVRFVHAPKATVFSFGYLVFRGKQNEEQPIVDKKANQDRTTVTMTAEQEQLFFPLFCLLRLIAPASARFTIGGGILSDAVSSEDGEKLFAQYEPYRYRAAKVLGKRKGIKPKEAKAAADYWFDSRQMDWYQRDPEKIPEDMNLALGIKQSIVRTDAMPHTIPEEDLVKKYSCYIGDNPQDSSAAMVKLRTDTGMSPMEAIRVVEAVYKHKEHSRQVTGADNTVRSTKACPVCGSENVADAKFCPFCGNSLTVKSQSTETQPQWRVGMPCPYCGGNKLEGNHCAYCGATLREELEKRGNHTGTGKGSVQSKYCCPLCKSRKVYGRAIPKRRSSTASIRTGNPLLLALYAIYFVMKLIYIFMPSRVECVCLDCGHSWTE